MTRNHLKFQQLKIIVDRFELAFAVYKQKTEKTKKNEVETLVQY